MAITDKMPTPPISGDKLKPAMGPGSQAAAGGEDAGYSVDGGEPVSDQEQKSYDSVVMQGVQLLDRNAEASMEMIRTAPGDKAEAAGKYVAGLMIQMDEAAGGAIPDEVVIPAAAEVAEQFAERLQIAGVPVDNAFLQRGAATMMADLGEYYGATDEELAEFLGSVPMEQIQRAGQEFGGFFGQQGGMGQQPPAQQQPMGPPAQAAPASPMMQGAPV